MNLKWIFIISITSHNCSKYIEPTQKESVTFKSAVNAFTCSNIECASKDVIEFKCEFCCLNFCMKHRLQVDHNCTNLPKYIESEKKPAKEFKFEMKQNVSEKNAGLAAKLILMKLKKSAVGPPGLPEELKFYCFINHLNDKKPFYFSMKWPVGRCIDFLFDKLCLNKSNLTTTKLWLAETLVDSSLIVDEFMRVNSVNQGAVLDLKHL